MTLLCPYSRCFTPHQHVGANSYVGQIHPRRSTKRERPADAWRGGLLRLRHLQRGVLRVVANDNQANSWRGLVRVQSEFMPRRGEATDRTAEGFWDTRIVVRYVRRLD